MGMDFALANEGKNATWTANHMVSKVPSVGVA